MLLTNGIYRVVRHPMYMVPNITISVPSYFFGQWLLLVMVATPVMKLDRFVVFVSAVLFLGIEIDTISSLKIFILEAIALPLEEEKLIEEFGQAYRDYQQVDAL